MAGVILAERDGANYDDEPVQVTLPRSAHIVDMAHYGRRRDIPADGNFNVMA